jgi:hypothetical protein
MLYARGSMTRGSSRGKRANTRLAAALVAGTAGLFLAPAANAAIRADFNHDGFEDLAIGIEGEDLPPPDDVLNAGAVEVIYGSAAGLDPVGPQADQFWHEEVPGVRGHGTGDDGFGDAVAAGDFDGDDRTDLAIGATGDIVKGESYAGSVRVLYGTNAGLTAKGDELFTEATTGVPGQPKEEDELGEVLAAGDFDGDGRDDLAAFVQGQRVTGKAEAGAVLVFRGRQSGLSAKGSRLWTEDSKGIAGKPAAFDQFGFALATGDFEHDGRDDLAVGVPYDKASAVSAAGTARVIYGSSKGLAKAGAKRFSQGSGGLLGAAGEGDYFGSSLATGRLDDGKRDDLAIGAPNDEVGALDGGTVAVLYGAGGGLDNTGNQLWNQDSTNVEGNTASADDFGTSLATGDFNKGNNDDLAIGVEHDIAGAVAQAGTVNILYGYTSGLSAAGDQLFHQDVSGMLGVAESADRFGAVVAAGNFDGDQGVDLAISVPSDDAGAVDNAGAVAILPGLDSTGVDAGADQLWDEALADIPNVPTAGESFGDALAAGS